MDEVRCRAEFQRFFRPSHLDLITMAATDPETKEASPSKAATQIHEVTEKHHMMVQDIPAANSNLGEVCELPSAEFG